MPRLILSVLGPFQASLDGHAIESFSSNKVRALLTYLALECDRPHPRSALAGLLWPGYAESSALTSLRSALANLRSAIGDREADPPFLLIARESLQFNPEGDYALDADVLMAATPGAIATVGGL
ncbi:MAG: hypothetical protein JXA74_04880, partial [Anaerolineae bacterium]|nr:hypothetical protein [Anaerolineae bacterium]